MKKVFGYIWFPLIIGGLSFLVFRYILFFGYVPTSSMEPTIAEGQYIFAVRMHGELKPGDIIVFRKENEILIKRITAVGSDTVYVNQTTSQVSVNQRLDDAKTLVVPAHQYFVTGDNQKQSLDSRYWKYPFIKQEDIIAKYCLF